MSKPYPWRYAVNARPVTIVETSPGVTDGFVFDFGSGNLTSDRSYVSLVGSGEHVDELTEQQFASLLVARRVDVLYQWAERLCRGEQLQKIASLEPAPLGATNVRVEARSIELTFPPSTIVKEQLEHRFGGGEPMTGPDLLTYELPIAGCTMLATYGEDGSVRTIVLRVDRA